MPQKTEFPWDTLRWTGNGFHILHEDDVDSFAFSKKKQDTANNIYGKFDCIDIRATRHKKKKSVTDLLNSLPQGLKALATASRELKKKHVIQAYPAQQLSNVYFREVKMLLFLKDRKQNTVYS